MQLKDQMKMHELYAHLHMTKALTGEYKKRVGKVTRGDGYVLKDQEILEDTIQTAERHIKLFIEYADKYSEQLEECEFPNKSLPNWYFQYKTE
jgi:hypothetical protein